MLIPCATPNAIHSRNAHRVQARLIIEGAHGPVSARADRILEDREIPIVPDILANGGGVVIAYFEWAQNRHGFAWIGDMLEYVPQSDEIEALIDLRKTPLRIPFMYSQTRRSSRSHHESASFRRASRLSGTAQYARRYRAN